MLTLIPLLYLVHHVRAQNSTSDTLEGWQFDDNSRSSWDILWTCVSTIFACTWASLHLSVDFTRRARIRRKFAGWFVSLFATEFIVIIAAIHFVTARDVAARCNAAFGVPKVETKSEEGLPVPAHARAIVEKMMPEKNSGPWTMVHGFCVDMCGFSLRTQDGWAYPIHSKNVVPLIEAGLIQPGDLDEAEIKDHAKSDGVAKLLAVVQSLWVVVNVFARAAYHLPISPLELSTVAYVFCAVIAYSLWWHKPQDMKTPITLHIPYNKTGENAFPGLDELLIAKPHLWRHQTLSISNKQESEVAKSANATAAPTAPATPTPAKISAIERPRHHVWSDGLVSKLPPQTEILFTLYAAIIFQGFCAIHVAAWNFVFPTLAERWIWRVLSLIALLIPWISFWIAITPLSLAWYVRTYKLDVPWLEWYIDPESRRTWIEGAIFEGAFFVYYATRAGSITLMMISLRALPAGSFTGIDWLSTIPHI